MHLLHEITSFGPSLVCSLLWGGEGSSRTLESQAGVGWAVPQWAVQPRGTGAVLLVVL